VPNVVNADINIGTHRAQTSSRVSRTNGSSLGSARTIIELAETVLSIG